MKYGLAVVVAAVLALTACTNTTAGMKPDYVHLPYNEGPPGGGR
jgi:hypothetical protein